MNDSSNNIKPENSNAEFKTADISKIQRWLKTLPEGDSDKALKILLSFIAQINQQKLDIVYHYQVLNLLAPTIDSTLKALKAPYLLEALPLSISSLAILNTKQQFLLQLSVSYKTLIKNISPLLSSHKNAMKLLCVAIFHSMHYASLLLVERYLTYMMPATHFWTALHQLYQMTCKHNLQQVSVSSVFNSNKKTNISNSYKRLLILANADPFHLMQTEVLKTFDHLEQWGRYAKFIDVNAFYLKGGLLVDFSLDVPAIRVKAYAHVDEEENNTTMLYLDISDMSKLTRIQLQKRTLAAHSEDEIIINKTTFVERSALSMYSRLNRVWSKTNKRNVERLPSDKFIATAVGLTICHRVTSDDREFTPEKDEINLKKNALGGSIRLTLVPKEHTPWVEKALEEDIKKGIVKPRESHFEEEDIWKKKRFTEYARESEKAENRKEIIIFDSLVRNKNTELGLGLYCKHDCGIQVHVGELISFKGKSENEQDWNVGIIKWLNYTDSTEISLGVESIHGNIKPVAVKAVSGVGKDSEYFRALTVENRNDSLQKTLITPSAVYDVNTVLLMNLKDELRFIRLSKLIESSSYYAHFSYDVTTDPELDRVDVVENAWI